MKFFFPTFTIEYEYPVARSSKVKREGEIRDALTKKGIDCTYLHNPVAIKKGIEHPVASYWRLDPFTVPETAS